MKFLVPPNSAELHMDGQKLGPVRSVDKGIIGTCRSYVVVVEGLVTYDLDLHEFRLVFKNWLTFKRSLKIEQAKQIFMRSGICTALTLRESTPRPERELTFGEWARLPFEDPRARKPFHVGTIVRSGENQKR